MTADEHFSETDDGMVLVFYKAVKKKYFTEKRRKESRKKLKRFTSCWAFWIVSKIEAV
jgi:hypothetical protein